MISFMQNFYIQMSDIQKRLREAIQLSPYSQRDIAQAIGVCEQTVSKYMNKDVFPALDTLAKLCIFLDVSADVILGITKN